MKTFNNSSSSFVRKSLPSLRVQSIFAIPPEEKKTNFAAFAPQWLFPKGLLRTAGHRGAGHLPSGGPRNNVLFALQKEEYLLETFKRSNQDTCLTHKPVVSEGTWVQSGDLLTDCASSVGGELSLGQNLLIAYMPWEGYNFEDAILISERLVMDDLYTSVHIERYELETQKTKLGVEEITRNIPDVSEKELAHLDSFGVVKLGSWVEEGDILVGKITPINKKKISPYQKLLYTILEKQVRPIKDSSLRAPKGIKAKVIDIKYFLKSSDLCYTSIIAKRIDSYQGKAFERSKGKYSKSKLFNEKRSFSKPQYMGVAKQKQKQRLEKRYKIFSSMKSSFLQKINLMFSKNYTCQLPLQLSKYSKGKKNSFNIRFMFLRYLWLKSKIKNKNKNKNKKTYSFDFVNKPDPIEGIKDFFSNIGKQAKGQDLKANATSLLPLPPQGSTSQPPAFLSHSFGVFVENRKGKRLMSSYPSSLIAKRKKSIIIKNIETIHIYLAEKRKIKVGDKMAGRHGNKGIVSQILPIIDMPYLPDGTPIDMVLNPLGVPSRMNVGQIYECLLGLAGRFLGENYKVYSFDEIYGPEASRAFVFNKLYEARSKTGFKWLFDPNTPGKIRLFDGRNGECFDQKVTVGQAYILRLVHMVDDKIHCLTPDHEVLTSHGWVPIAEVTLQHQVATLENKTGELVYQKPNNVLHYPNYNGPLYHIKNANVDLVVTLNHRMYVRKGRIHGASFTDYQLIQANDIIGKHYRYLKNANWTKDDYQFILPAVVSNSVLIPEKKVNMDAWLMFFGLWIAEGWDSMASQREAGHRGLPKGGHRGAVNNEILLNLKGIPSSLEDISADLNNIPSGLEDIFANLNKNPTDFVDVAPVLSNSAPVSSNVYFNNSSLLLKTKKSLTKAVYQDQICQYKQSVLTVLSKAVTALGYKYRVVDDKLTIHDTQLWAYLRPLSVGSPSKSLPSWVWQLSQKQAQSLLYAMCLGDGTWRDKPLSYYTSSVKLADDVMRLALHAGWSGNKYLHNPKGSIGGTIKGRVICNNFDVWRVSIIQSKNNPAVNHGYHKNPNCQKEEVFPYQGPVHCLSVPNEVFYVRRNGIPVWTGNSRSTGPYSLVTQQPLRGRSKQGGQRLGEMEVWALEGYGAAFTLLEMLTIKSDDMTGRMTLWSNLILNKDISIGTPESFKVLVCELQALCLDIGLFRNIEPNNPNSNLREINNLMNLP